MARHGTALHRGARHSTAEHGTALAQHGTAQHWHSTAQHGTALARLGMAQHRTALARHGTYRSPAVAHSFAYVPQAPLSPLPPAGLCFPRGHRQHGRAGRGRYRPGPAARPRTSRSGDSGAAVRDRGSVTAARCPASCGASVRFLPAGSGL